MSHAPNMQPQENEMLKPIYAEAPSSLQGTCKQHKFEGSRLDDFVLCSSKLYQQLDA
jgi:hypothetical protein